MTKFSGRYKYAQRMKNLEMEDERLIEVYHGEMRRIECLRCEKMRDIRAPNRICDRCKASKDLDHSPELKIIR